MNKDIIKNINIKKVVAVIASGAVLVTMGSVLKKIGSYEDNELTDLKNDTNTIYEGEIYKVSKDDNLNGYNLLGVYKRGDATVLKDILSLGLTCENNEYYNDSYVKDFIYKKISKDSIIPIANSSIYYPYIVSSDDKESKSVNLRVSPGTQSDSIVQIKNGDTVYLDVNDVYDVDDENIWCSAIYISKHNQVIKGYFSPCVKSDTKYDYYNDINSNVVSMFSELFLGLHDSSIDNYGGQRAIRDLESNEYIMEVYKEQELYTKDEYEHMKYIVTSEDGRNLRTSPSLSDENLIFNTKEHGDTNIFLKKGTIIEANSLQSSIIKDGYSWMYCTVDYNGEVIEGYITNSDLVGNYFINPIDEYSVEANSLEKDFQKIKTR